MNITIVLEEGNCCLLGNIFASGT